MRLSVLSLCLILLAGPCFGQLEKMNEQELREVHAKRSLYNEILEQSLTNMMKQNNFFTSTTRLQTQINQLKPNKFEFSLSNIEIKDITITGADKSIGDLKSSGFTIIIGGTNSEELIEIVNTIDSILNK